MGSGRIRPPLARRFMTWVLRSPFSDLADGAVMLITVRGRRTGTEYTLPVQYAQNAGIIWVFPAHHERKTGWRNLASESSVTLHLRGHDLAAMAQSFSGKAAPAVVEEGLRVYLQRFDAIGRRMGAVRRDGSIDEPMLGEMAKTSVIVRIELPGTTMQPQNEDTRGATFARGSVAAIRRHPLGAFYIIAFLLSWAYWVPDALAGGKWSHAPGLLGPMISAIVVTAVTKGSAGLRDFVRRMFRWRVQPRWYLWLLAPLGLALAATTLLSLGPRRFPSFAEWSEMGAFASIGGWAAYGVIFLVNGYGEEAGWRGFATPALRRRYSELTASLLVAVPWALWHLPTFFIDSGYRDFPLLFLPGWLLGFFGLAVVMTWMYEGSRASILIAALMHLSVNVSTTTTATEGAISAIVSMALIVWSIVIAARWHRRRPANEIELEAAR